MRLLIVGRLHEELGEAARIAIANGARVLHAESVAQALAMLRGPAAPDAVLCDVRLDAVALIESARRERIEAEFIVCGSHRQADLALGAIRAGAREFLTLPPDADAIAGLLLSVSRSDPSLIFADPLMAATVRRAEQVAASEATLLITGESGTGKEVLARHVHARSRRARAAFVAVNCAAIPDTLLESELFGHEKGAFSGAVARRIGKFEAADGGTLLLDEIGEMDLRMQAKLLRVVQEREVDRIGGAGPVRIDVRVIAATNRELTTEIAAGRFRDDLYFRLNVVRLRLPALRERPADIAVLAAHFAERYAQLNGLPLRRLDARALARLSAHGWRGNVRELENVVHRAVLMAEGDAIGAEAVEFDGAPEPQGLAVAEPGGGFVGRSMDEIEREAILRTLRHTAGNRTHAATILGISIRALRNKLRDYMASGIEVPPPASGCAA